MRIAIVGPSPVPYTRGGIEDFMAALYRTINDSTDHVAELIKVPVRETTVPEILRAYWRFSRMNLDHFDMIITSKYPAWMIRHHHHVIYLGHRLRGLYDTYPGSPEKENLLQHSFFRFPGPWIRKIVHFLDNRAIRPDRISYAYAFSETVAARTEYFHPELSPQVVYCATGRDDYRCGDARYFFTVSRLDPPKRIDLLIRAYRKVSGNYPLIIAGTGPHESSLRRLAAGDARIRFTGSVPGNTLVALYADALAVPYIPYREDLGLITLEAMKSGKPVVTVSDSGGPTEFVRDGETGWIADPDADALAAALQKVVDDPDRARAMGAAAASAIAGITWENTVDTLLAPFRHWPGRGPRRAGERRRVMVLVPYPVHPPRSGGPRRIASLYGELTRCYELWLITVGRYGDAPVTRRIAPHFYEVSVPISHAHAQQDWAMEKSLGVAVTDAMLPELVPLSPNIRRTVNHFLDCCDMAVSSQPYLHHLLHKTSRCRVIVHESQNYEWLLKKQSLTGTGAGERLLRRVRAVERRALASSDLILSVASDEMRELAENYDVPISRFIEAPNGVDIREIKPPDPAAKRAAREMLVLDNRPVALFMAAWHPPNLEGFRFILETLAPALPQIQFIVVGSVKAQYEARVGPLHSPDNCRVTGVVDESTRRDILMAADVGLNPMFSGSGTNLKILEYFAAGLPVISTSLGIRGLKVVPGESVVVCSGEEFPETLKTVTADPELSRRIAAGARRIVEKHYDWQIIADAVLTAAARLFPPEIPLEHVHMNNRDLFKEGWYPVETWEDSAGGVPRSVRWSESEAAMGIPGQPHACVLTFQLLGRPDGSPVEIVLDGMPVFNETVPDRWTPVSVPVPFDPGTEWHLLQFRADPWRPADSGSPDTRTLGIAISALKMEIQP